MPMERIEVVERAAATLRGTSLASGIAPAERIGQLCAALKFEVNACSGHDTMLGGAYSRLQLWDWEQPEYGGIIWLRDDLDRETRLFAIAHELGHYQLHRGERINVHAPCDQQMVDQQADPAELRAEDHVVQEYSPRVRREQEASAFAAELLAPRAEVRRIFTTDAGADAARIATHFGISRELAHRRLIDAVLAPTRPIEHASVATTEAATDEEAHATPGELLARLDGGQRRAAQTPGPALVVAGPGTGKTATLVGRVAYLVEERHVPPERVLALTFSNRAAGEMRERLMRSGLPGERMPIMTIHAFAATLLREYASQVPHAPDEAELKQDFRILDMANAYLLMEGLLGELPLHFYRSLGNPTAHLDTLLKDFSHARDELLTPDDYLALVDAMKPMPETDEAPEAAAAEMPTGQGRAAKKAKSRKPQPPDGMFTREQIARARERAEAYAVWDRALRQRGLVDFGGLVQRAVELLRARPDVLADVRARYPEMLVDEFQDTNHAAAELLMLVAGAAGGGLWVVGDQNQSIYRFRGASPRNLRRLAEHYPNLRVLTLQRCYRAVPAIVRLGSAMAERMATLAPSATETFPGAETLRQALQSLALEPVRGNGDHSPVRHAEKFVSAAHERVGLAATIERYHAAGYGYGDQAILCRTHKQMRQITAVLAGQHIPVSQLGDFFERPEVKDAMMLFLLAAGPDARGILRADPLLVGLGYPPSGTGELAATARYFASQRGRFPGALRGQAALSQITALSPTTRAGLIALGEETTRVRNSPAVGHGLAAFLLRPGGIAWRLARVADGQDAPQTQTLPHGTESRAQAQQALAALGELVRLAWRFDLRWLAEPDFQARLIQLVAHRRPARPTEPDTLTPPPDADVITDAVAPSTSSGTHAQPGKDPTAVSCFLHYLRALRATDVTIPIPAGEDDTVHVLTLHQSKGLEFPVVLLPNLAHGQFPGASHNREEVCPPGFRESDSAGERDAEERCLFYVGVTRARDVVALTRATSYSASATGSPSATERSSLLALLDDAADWANAEPLHSDSEYANLLIVAAPFEEKDDDEGDDESSSESDDEAVPPAALRQESSDARAPVRTYELSDLLQYRECPRQYRYTHNYRLFDPTEDAVFRFHRYIRQSTRELHDTKAGMPQMDWQAAQDHLRSLWEEVGPAGHAYEAFYWQAAEAILREEWQAITSPQHAAASQRVLLAQPLVARLRHCMVEVKADREIATVVSPGDGAAVQPMTVLVRLHTGRPRGDHKTDLTLPLYYLAFQQRHPGVPVRIVLAYTGGTQEGGATSVYDPANWEDVTEHARQVAEAYLNPTRKRRSQLDKLDDAAKGIASGRFAPRPDERRCPACAYCYVCPADLDSAAAIPVVTSAGADPLAK